MESFASGEDISKVEKIEGGWVDRIKKITYPAAFMFGVMSSEVVFAAEIPADASLEDGIFILEQAAIAENFETAAAYITLPDGRSFWISKEGREKSVNLFTGYGNNEDDAIEGFLEDIITSDNLTAGQVLDIDHYHNHPMQSMFPGYSDDWKFSIRPSGMGFLTDGDTGFYNREPFDDAIEKIKERSGISVTYDKHVVDAIGTWSWSYIDKSNFQGNPVYEARKKLEELYQITTRDTYEEQLPLHTIIDEARLRFDTVSDNWLDSSFDIDSPEFQSLITAYRQVGIEMSFTPHSIK